MVLTSQRSFFYRQAPNLISGLRILAVPFVIWLVVAEWGSFGGRLSALILLVLSASTDGIDGALARRRGLVTNLGKLLDPIADKALLSGALVALSLIGEVSWWATGLILIREFGITVFRLVVAKSRVISANAGGKFKTVMQIIAISLIVAPFEFLGGWFDVLGQIVLWFTVALTLVTGAAYLRPQK